MKIAWTALLSSLTFAGAGTASAEPQACEIAKVVLAEQLGTKQDRHLIVITKRGYGGNAVRNRPVNVRDDWKVAPPSAETALALQEAAPQDAWSVCPSVRRLARARGVHLWEDKTPPRLGPQGDYASEMLAIGLPVLNRAGTEALVVVDKIGSPESGLQWVALLRRSKAGTWVATGKVITVVS
jgi:hypothetical protein